MFAPLLIPILAFSSGSFSNRRTEPLEEGSRVSAIVLFGLWIVSYFLGG